jgi:hypothetical protein
MLFRLLRPGMRIKRWLALLIVSIAALSYGVGSFLRNLVFRPGSALSPLVRALTLQNIPNPYRDIGLIAFGLLFALLGGYGLLRALTAPFAVPTTSGEWVRSVIRYQRLQRGPSITVVGGGSPLADTLRAVKLITHDLAAVFAVGRADLHPDSILEAARPLTLSLSELEPVMERILSHPVDRDEEGDHNVGDIFLRAAVASSGDVEDGLAAGGQVLAVRGQVIPAAIRDEVSGEPRASYRAVQAVLDCDLLLIVLDDLARLERAVFAYGALRSALHLSRGMRLGLLPPGSDLAALGGDLSRLLGADMLDFILADDGSGRDRSDIRRAIRSAARVDGVRVVRVPLVEAGAARADPTRLAAAVDGFYQIMLPRHLVRWRV